LRPGRRNAINLLVPKPDRHRAGFCQTFHDFYASLAIPADSFARAVAFAISQPEGVDINEILFRPTAQEL
jgi:NADP-dependent 3-hydroxy acid dehydrogenase YdfG